VVANRLPQPGAAPLHYHACLVSLEHREDLYGAPATSSLLLLHRWDFITDTGGTFASLCEGLSVGVLGQADGADAQGRVVVEHTARSGAPGTGTYRGPFTVGPVPLATDPSDVSYDAAYELGRLLGAADGPFTRDLVDWHRSAGHAAHDAQQHGPLRAMAPAGDALDLSSQPAHVAAAATGLLAALRSVSPQAPHRARRPSRDGRTDA
jgi:hypothetical protein